MISSVDVHREVGTGWTAELWRLRPSQLTGRTQEKGLGRAALVRRWDWGGFIQRPYGGAGRTESVKDGIAVLCLFGLVQSLCSFSPRVRELDITGRTWACWVYLRGHSVDFIEHPGPWRARSSVVSSRLDHSLTEETELQASFRQEPSTPLLQLTDDPLIWQLDDSAISAATPLIISWPAASFGISQCGMEGPGHLNTDRVRHIFNPVSHQLNLQFSS